MPPRTYDLEQIARTSSHPSWHTAYFLIAILPLLVLLSGASVFASAPARLALILICACATTALFLAARRRESAHDAQAAAWQEQASALAAQTAEQATTTAALAGALDTIRVGLIWVGEHGHIRYANAAVRVLLAPSQAELLQVYPGIDVSLPVGTVFAPWATFAAAVTAAGTAGSSAIQTLALGDRTLEWSVDALAEDAKAPGSFMIQWRDATPEAREGAEIAQIIDAVERGDFSRRLHTSGKSAAAQQVAKGFNRLVGTMSRGLEDTARVLNAISRGVLTERVTSEFSGTFGQLKDDSNASVDRLRETIEHIKDAAGAIHEAAREIASGNLDLSNRTELQAGHVEKTASAMEELNSTVHQNAEHAHRASALATKSDTVAREGARIVIDVVTTMATIQESSKRIADIVGVIDGIAFQTNILALNAAVEAARAGEQGRGFAVVASEVRALAQRSATAAKEIKTLIAKSEERVEHGAALATSAGRIIEDVVVSVREVNEILGQVANASREQSQGLSQVTDAIQQLDHGTQQNAALVEEAAAAAASLHDQAGLLSNAVARFQLDTGASALGSGDAGALDYDAVIAAHLQWKHKLRDFLDGQGAKLDPEVVSRDDKCALGCWIHSDRMRNTQDASFRELKAAHASFHRCAGQVIRHHLAKEVEAADQLLNDEFLALSERTVQHLRAMKKRN